MTRNILYSRMLRGLDPDAGGAAELQTDVMRFMAILSLCLVAIFALVQSLPSAPPVVATVSAPLPAKTRASEPPPPAAPTRPAPIPVPASSPLRETQPPPAATPLTDVGSTPSDPGPASIVREARAEPTPEETAAAPRPAAATVAEEQQGFTLQFATDQALTALVAAGRVSLYAIAGDSASRLTFDRGKPQFQDVAMPRQYHEMESTTVPDVIVAGHKQNFATDNRPVQWGVTLPRSTANALQKILQQHQGGSLIIDGRGQLRLEQ